MSPNNNYMNENDQETRTGSGLKSLSKDVVAKGRPLKCLTLSKHRASSVIVAIG